MGKDKEAPKTSTELTEKINVFEIDSNSWTQL